MRHILLDIFVNRCRDATSSPRDLSSAAVKSPCDADSARLVLMQTRACESHDDHDAGLTASLIRPYVTRWPQMRAKCSRRWHPHQRASNSDGVRYEPPNRRPLHQIASDSKFINQGHANQHSLHRVAPNAERSGSRPSDSSQSESENGSYHYTKFRWVIRAPDSHSG